MSNNEYFKSTLCVSRSLESVVTMSVERWQYLLASKISQLAYKRPRRQERLSLSLGSKVLNDRLVRVLLLKPKLKFLSHPYLISTRCNFWEASLLHKGPYFYHSIQ